MRAGSKLPPEEVGALAENAILSAMAINDYNLAAQQVAAFLRTLNSTGGMRLKFRITAGDGAADPDGLETRDIFVELGGPDAPLLLQRNGELLHALEHVAAKILRLEPEEHDRVSFDSGGFKAMRARELKLAAETAAERVRRTGEPFSFQPMSSRERRMLHLAMKPFEDLRTESSGEGPRRFVIAYPKGYQVREGTGREGRPERGRSFGRR